MAPSVKVRLEVEGAPEAVAAVRAFAAQSKAAGAGAASEFTGAAGAIGKLTGALQGAGRLFVAYKIAQLGAATARFTAETVRLAAEQKDLALSLGTTIRNYSAMAGVAKSTNTEQGKLNAGLGALADRIKDLRSGSPEATRAFRQLGLSAKDFTSDDIVVNAVKVGEALERVARGGSKGAAAVEVLGKNGRALLPVFAKINELGGLEGATRFAERFGVLVDNKTAAMFDAIATELQQMDSAARRLALEFAKAFGPGVIAALREIQRLFGDVKPVAAALGSVIGVLARLMAAIVIDVVALGTALANIATLRFDKLVADFKRFDEMLKELGENPVIAPVDDTVGPPAADLAAREAAFAKLREQLADAERDRLTAMDKADEAVLEQSYARRLISLGQYYVARAAIIAAAFDREIQIFKDKLVKAESNAEREALESRIQTLIVERAAALQGLSNEFAAARGKVKTFATELRDNLEKRLIDFATNGINQVRSLGDAFLQLGRIVAQVAQQTAAQFLIQAITSFLFPTPVKKAAGGLISGPGTETSDSILARLSRGEYVVRAAAVRQPGVLPHLEALNSGRFQELVRQNLSYQLQPRRYADGGLVEQSPLAGGSSSVGGSIQIGLDDGLILRALESPAGQRVLLKVVARSPRAFGAAIRR